MKLTAKKVQKGDKVKGTYTEINVGRIKGTGKVWGANGWAIFDENDNPVSETDRLSGKEVYGVYQTKRTAQKVAEYIS